MIPFILTIIDRLDWLLSCVTNRYYYQKKGMGLRSKKDVVKLLKTFHNNFNNNYIYISIQKKQIPWVIFVA